MIVFKKIRWMNLLSTGNQFTELDLVQSTSTLIVGENGSGKSTMLDALSFVLFNKCFRKVTLGQLINSITQKQLLVEVEFSIGSTEYVVRRGLKPRIFEIYKNDELLNQPADTKDYQDILESTILKINHKSFSQIVVLGSANYVPFMQLKPDQRRMIIEDLLDLQVFSVMNVVLKERVGDNKSRLSEIDKLIAIAEAKIQINNEFVSRIATDNKEQILLKQEEYERQQSNLECYSRNSLSLKEIVNDLQLSISDDGKNESILVKLASVKTVLKGKIKILHASNKFYADYKLNNCPTCNQSITPEFSESVILDNTSKIEKHNVNLLKADRESEICLSRKLAIGKVKNQITIENTMMMQNHANISTAKQLMASLDKEIKLLNEKMMTIQEEDKSEQLESDLAAHVVVKAQVMNDRELYNVASQLLKDDGIKAHIIKQYVPVMNRLVNQYLSELDFFVDFELDESFSEKIKSRYRDEFSYDSFSEGEKARLDLALLFAWRELARLRNSMTTNLLILDEVFDSSLDSNGTDELLKILTTVRDGTNIFVISHKGDQLIDKFSSTMKFEKDKNFSRITYHV